MSLAKTPDSTTAPCALSEEFDNALSEARTITLIISSLANTAGIGDPSPATFGWLAEELDARLKRIEAVDMAMWDARI